MKRTIKILISVITLILAALLMTSCFEDPSPYSGYDEEGYSVSVRYDANGGTFTTNTSVIVDTYNVSEFPTNSAGEKLVTLVSPDNTVRGPENSFLPQKAGCFLAGWYTQKLPVTDAEGNELDANGNIAEVSGEPVAYNYSGRWDFDSDKLAVDLSDVTGSDEPVLTLYAAWAPRFSFDFYDLDTGNLIGNYEFDPIYINGITVPEWDPASGMLDMHEFPKVENKTFNNVYFDPAGENPVTDTKILHTGVLNIENATTSGGSMSLYVDMLDGNWYNVYTAEQFIQYSYTDASFNILADLDFEGLGWSTTLMYGDYTGTIKGNGYTFKNITATQSDTSQYNAGLFGTITGSVKIEDLTFENVTFNITTGSRRSTAAFGLLCGTLSADAIFENVSVSGKIVVTPTPLITESTNIGLLCGMGNAGSIDLSGISCEALEPEDEYTDAISLTVDGNTVKVTVIPTA